MISEKFLLKLLGKSLSGISLSDVSGLLSVIRGKHKGHRHHRHSSRKYESHEHKHEAENERARTYELEENKKESVDSVLENLNDEEKEELIRLLNKLTGTK